MKIILEMPSGVNSYLNLCQYVFVHYIIFMNFNHSAKISAQLHKSLSKM